MHDPTSLTGQIFEDRFRVEAEVGRGSMAVVFRATHLVTEQVVALKVMKEPIGGDEPRSRRFLQEIRATARLNHPNTVRVLDAGRSSEGFLWLAMEYLEGDSLRHVLDREKRLPPTQALHIGRQVARALAEAHGKLLVHRDLKPENILLTRLHGEADFVKVLDFGVAKFLSEQPGEEPLTRAGDLLGTPLYLAPEQALERAVDGRADLYSLGCMLVEMITGDPPFRASTPVAIVMRHIHDPAPRLSHRVGNVPKDLDDLVAGMLEKDPNQRPQTMQKWLEAADRLAPLPDRVLPLLPATGPSEPVPEAATVLLEIPREVRTATPPPQGPGPATPIPQVPVAPRPQATRNQTEEDIVFLSDGPPETLLLPKEEAIGSIPAAAPGPARPPGPLATAGGPTPSSGASRAVRVAVGLVVLAGAGAAGWWFVGSRTPSGVAPESTGTVPAVVSRSPGDPEPPRPEPVAEPSPAPDGAIPSTTAPAAPAAPAVSSPAPTAAASPAAEPLEVSLLTDPPGAEVLLDGTPRGRTPYRLTIRPTDPLLRLTLKAPGYRDLTVTLLPQDLASSGRRDLTWQLQKGTSAPAPAARTPGVRRKPGPEPGPTPARPTKKPAVNWDE
ncbi:MAG TPA: protein kinase [Myxococcota bacterium]|nr:protein kinase [Myxococcota bacterium]HQK49696.1 protein kinase [Myxococcota bacterium]